MRELKFRAWDNTKKEIIKTLENLVKGVDGWNEPFYH